MLIKFSIPVAFVFFTLWFSAEQKQLKHKDYNKHYSCLTEKYDSLDIRFKEDSINFVEKIQYNSREIKKDLIYLQKVDILMDSINVLPKDKRKGWLNRQLKEIKQLNHK